MRVLIASAILLLFQGCATVHTPHDGPSPRARPKTTVRVEKIEGVRMAEVPYLETENYRVQDLWLYPGSTVSEARYFESKKSGKQKLVVILPIYGSTELPSRTLAAYMTEWNANADYNIILIRDRWDILDWDAMGTAETKWGFFKIAGRAVLQFADAVAEVRRAVFWTTTRPEIDPDRIGIVGLSLGAAVASVATALDNRIRAGVFFLGGGNLHEMVARSRFEKSRLIRERAYTLFGLTPLQFEERLKNIFRPIEPIRFRQTLSPDRILYFDATDDDFIPKDSREALWNNLGRPERITFFHAHKVSFLSFTILGLHFANRTIFEFFERVFH